jgi:hypothetical protein
MEECTDGTAVTFAEARRSNSLGMSSWRSAAKLRSGASSGLRTVEKHRRFDRNERMPAD